MIYNWFRVKYSSHTMANKTLHHTISIFFSMLTEITTQNIIVINNSKSSEINHCYIT